MKKILTDAVAIGNAVARANNYYPRNDLKMVYFYQDNEPVWKNWTGCGFNLR
jgi:hypothetical protein